MTLARKTDGFFAGLYVRLIGYTLLIVTICGGVLILLGVSILVYQCFIWLKKEDVPSYDVDAVWTYFRWHRPLVNWAGLQRIIGWLLSCPLSLTALLVGGIVVRLGLAGIKSTVTPRGRHI